MVNLNLLYSYGGLMVLGCSSHVSKSEDRCLTLFLYFQTQSSECLVRVKQISMYSEAKIMILLKGLQSSLNVSEFVFESMSAPRLLFRKPI